MPKTFFLVVLLIIHTSVAWIISEDHHQPVSCNIAVFALFQPDSTENADPLTLTAKRFETDFDLKAPFVLKGGAAAWKATERWTREHILSEYGDAEVKVGLSSKIVGNSGDGAERTTIREFLQQAGAGDGSEGPYVFDRGSFVKEHPEILQDIQPPLFFKPEEGGEDSIVVYFLLGGPNSGIPLHSHTDGWNALIHGRKRWFFYPPEELPPLDFPVYRGQFAWERETYPAIKANSQLSAPLECLQEAGDIVYIPEGWFHATSNLGETIGVAAQRLQPRLKFLQLLHLGQKRRLQGRTQESVDHLIACTSLGTSGLTFEAFNELGLSYEASSRSLKAIDALNQAIQVCKLSPFLFFSRFAPQCESSLLLVQLNPRFAEAHYNLGRVLKQKGDLALALSAFKEAASLDSSDPDHFLLLAHTERALGHGEEAIKCTVYPSFFLLSLSH